MISQATLDADSSSDKAGKYLTFMLGREYYGLEIQKVREIVALMPITPVPRTHRAIKGVVNLRGRVIPVMDLRLKLGLAPNEPDRQTCIVIVASGSGQTGMIVDRVCDVMDVAHADVDDAPSFGTRIDAGFLLGIGKTGGRVTMLLDVDVVLTGNEDL